MRLPSFLAALLLAAPALAQDTVPLTPSHEDLSAAPSLTYESQTFDVRTAEPDQSLGAITQTVTMDGDFVVIVTDANVPQLGQVSRDSVRVLRASLAPDFVVTTNRNGELAVADFDALRVIGSYGPAGRELPIELELKEPAFHGGGSVPADGAVLVARALPFEEGYTGTFTTFSPTRRLREVALTVAGQEQVTQADGSTVTAWAVEESTAPGGTVQRTYYIAPETRELVRIEFSQRGTEAVIVPADEAAMAAEAAARDALPQIAPGSDDLMPVAPYEATYVLQLVQPQEMEIGTTTNRLTIDEAAGTATLVTVVDIPMQGATQRDSVVAAYPSLAPISQTASGGGATIEVDYADGAISGQVLTPSGEEIAIDEAIDGPVFSASFLSEVVRALPLAEGYEARLRAFAPGGGILSYTVEVTGQDEATGGWTVAVTPEGAPPTIYVIDPDSREVLRSRLQPQVGVVIDVVPQD